VSDALALSWLDRLLDLDDAERAAQLQALATDDPALHARLQRLLTAAMSDDSSLVLAHPIIDGLRAAPQLATLALEPEQTFAGYRLLRELGRGGMSVVWLAERVDGVVKRQVALKLPMFVLSSPLDIERFAREKDVLASLTHPHIARLYDAGVAPSGQPFIAIEFVDGLSVTEYCDRHRLGILDRLRLFQQVLAAVDHAHKHLVVHRDLKPSNILVDAEGQVKLLDFGIAKLLADPTSNKTVTQLTRDGGAALTPFYAAPEQVSGEPISIFTDVYVLGVVLHELLTGKLPYAHAFVESPSLAQILEALLSGTPTHPSQAAIDDVAAHARSATNAKRLRTMLAGDLDSIVLMALRKEPARRYASADRLSEDLRRYLIGQPVLARKSTLRYQLGKFVARHKVIVTAAAIVTLTLIVGLLVTLREARIARENELRAEQHFNDVRRLANSMIFEVQDAIRPLPGAVAVRKLIVQRAQEYLENLSRESAHDPALLRELAAAYSKLANVQGDNQSANVGETKGALENFRKATSLLESVALLQPNNRDVGRELAESYLDIALTLGVTGDAGGQQQYLKKAVQNLETLTTASPEDQALQHALGKAYERTASSSSLVGNNGDLNRTLEYYLKADDIYQRLHRTQPQNRLFTREVSFSHKHIGSVLAVQNQFPTALDHYRAAQTIEEAVLALDPQSVTSRYNITYTYSDIGYVLGEQGDMDGALSYYRKVLAIRETLVATDPLDTRTRGGVARTLNYIGYNLAKKNDYPAALDSYKRALGILETLSRQNTINEVWRFEVASTQNMIGNVYARMSRQSSALHGDTVKYCRESQEWLRKALPVWTQMNAQDKLRANDAELDTMKRNIAACDRAIRSSHAV